MSQSVKKQTSGLPTVQLSNPCFYNQEIPSLIPSDDAVICGWKSRRAQLALAKMALPLPY